MSEAASSKVFLNISTSAVQRHIPDTKPLMQIALVIDTGAGMSGIDSVIKSQLWKIANSLVSAEKDGIPAEVNIAVYEYGNDSIPAGQKHTRKILSFVPDFDAVAEKLFLLKFRGKNKYCGAAIWASINGLDWDRGQDVYKAIFIIGNGSFFDGPVDYRNAVAASSRKGIQVNCIYYGSKEQGIEAGWAGCSDLGAGKYSNYEYAAKFVEEQTQFDKKILKLYCRSKNSDFSGLGKFSVEYKLQMLYISHVVQIFINVFL